MTLDTARLPQKVFETIVRRLASRAEDIARFTSTEYSFEEWLNWEAFAACAMVDAWRTHPKPSYCQLGVKGCKDFGDLLVVENDDKLLIEIGLVHDGTGKKWRDKLARDVEKLARPLNGIACLQIVVLTSTSNIEAAESRKRWLANVPCWNRPGFFEANTPLPPTGQMLVRAWATSPCSVLSVGVCNGKA